MTKEVRLDVVSRLFDDKGDETSVALTFDNVVVEVHKSQFHDTLYYSLGKIDFRGSPNVEAGRDRRRQEARRSCQRHSKRRGRGA